MEDKAKSITPATVRPLELRNHPSLPFTCDSCEEILLFFTDDRTDREMDSYRHTKILGDIPTMKRKRECIVCQAVLGILLPESEIEDLTAKSTAVNAEQVTFKLRLYHNSFRHLKIVRATLHDHHGNEYGSISAFEGDEVDYAGVHCKVYDNPIDPKLYSTWIRGCNNLHKEDGNDPQSFDSLGPYLTNDMEQSEFSLELIAIDVVDECLVEITSNHRYVALSYVWGGVTGLQLLVSNRRELETPGRLSLKEASGEIFPGIRSAMILVKQMDERYLWVDRLCIEQDNQKSKHFNISNMDLIYSQALITFVDLSSLDATKPIPGILGRSRIPVNKTWTFQLPFENTDGTGESRSISLVARPAALEDTLDRSAYEKRAWTFQERLLSKRCLFFTEYAAFFYCEHGVCHCDADSVSQGNRQVQRYRGRDLQARLDPLHLEARTSSQWKLALAAYTILVDQYSMRELSFVTDKLNAFAGILATLMRSLPGSTAGGLPESLIHFCLLWNDLYPPDYPLERNRDFPSWSWASSNLPASYYHGPLYLHSILLRLPHRPSIGLDTSLISKLENVGTFFETSIRPTVRIQSDFEHTQPEEEQYTRLGKDVLYFDAEVCSIAHFRTSQKYGNAQIRTHPEERPCGLLYSCPWTMEPDSIKYTEKYDLVLLSTVKCYLCMGSEARDWTGHESWAGLFLLEFMKQDYCSQFDCTLNHVMLIEWHESRQWAERVGIATIHGKAWESCERRRMRVTLK